MRVLGSIPHPICKITLFDWNQKFLVKIEQGACEQTYKIAHLDVAGEAEFRASITSDFIDRALARFRDMHEEVHRWGS